MDVKETKEALAFANELLVLLVKRLKDGIGVDDAVSVISTLATDVEFKAAAVNAFNGIHWFRKK